MTDHNNHLSALNRRISRRHFLHLAGVTAAGVIAAGCRENKPATTLPTATLPPVIPSTTSATTKPGVAIARAATYDRKLVRQQVQSMLDNLGGLKDIIQTGSKVVIKTNLTGGNNFNPPSGFTAITSYVTHPEVVRAVAELARDAGAGQIYIVEAVYDPGSYANWGYTDIIKDLNATLIDLNSADPYPDFVDVSLPNKGYFFDKFTCNRILQEADTFISVAKMKCHYNAGITLSMKNLVGMVPVTKYRASQADWWRSALHSGDTKSRLPRIILDLNRARPIHLAVIDGIMTAEGGEAPRGSFKPVQPGVLVAGKNPLATDAVAAAVMSFDPTVEPPNSPFLRGDNYLNLAASLGLGTNRLEEIEVFGEKIDEVKYKFNPASSMG